MKVTQLEQLYRDGMSRLKEQKKRQEQGRLEQTVKRLSESPLRKEASGYGAGSCRGTEKNRDGQGK